MVAWIIFLVFSFFSYLTFLAEGISFEFWDIFIKCILSS